MKKNRSMADRLAGKRRRRTHYDLPLTDADAEQAEFRAAEIARAQSLLRYPEGHEQRQAAADRLTAARDALAEHVFRITFQGIPEHEFEAMRTEHPPTEEQLAEYRKAKAEHVKAKDEHVEGEEPPVQPRPPDVNARALLPVLFARCVVPDEGETAMTVEQWEHELRPDGEWQEAERNEAFGACLQAIYQPRTLNLGNG